MLTIVSTPIGNLGDITRRAILALEEADLVLCEDTRRTLILLSHLGLRKPLLSLHKFNEKRREKEILFELKKEKKVVLVSDAGTPTVNDPGLSLVRLCIEEEIPFTALPGPCSYIQALVLSGFDSTRFQCLGFLPKAKGARKKAFLEALEYPGTTLAFESPHRLVDTLKILTLIAPDRIFAIARELTKVFEECKRGSPLELHTHYSENRPRGEITLLLSPKNLP